MTAFALGSVGGLVSWASTSMGTAAAQLTSDSRWLKRFQLSGDFALGMMLSASVFGLIGPVLLANGGLTVAALKIFFAVLAGALFVGGLSKVTTKLRWEREGKVVVPQSQILLATMLMLHNFPEGLASGAALAGLELQRALPLVVVIALQNIPEGAIMFMTLLSLGFSKKRAFLGGVLSGFVEMVGGVIAGLTMGLMTDALPFVLAFTGGAMIFAVLHEISDVPAAAWRRVRSRDFVLGATAPLLLQLL